MTLRKLLAGLAVVACLAGCVGGLKGSGDLAPPDALAALQAGTIRLIDIRTPAEWRQTGVAPGAIRIDYLAGEAELEQALLSLTGGDRDAPIALICRTGNRSARARAYLQSQNFSRVYNVPEGMAGSDAGPGWILRGLPVVDCAGC